MTDGAPGAGRGRDEPRPPGRLPARRVLTAAAVLVAGLPALVAVLVARRDDLAEATHVLAVLALVIAVSLVGGVRVGLPAAVAGALALNWFLTPPYGTLAVDETDQLVVLLAYLAVATAVSAVVARAAASAAEAARAGEEAATLTALAGQALAEHATLPGVLEQVRTAFGMREVVLEERTDHGWAAVERAAGPPAGPAPGDAELVVPAGPDARMLVRGRPLSAEDRRVLGALADTAATALEGRRLAARAADAARFEAADRARSTLLTAVGHDLRTPLAGIKVAVSSLRATDVTLTPLEQAELLATIEDGADRLQALVDDLLDASRLQAGAVTADLRPTGVNEAVDRALVSMGSPERVHLELDESLPDACADAGLVERILANLVQNALRYSPAGTLVTVRTSARQGQVRCDVVDHGPGLPRSAWPSASEAFSRLGDRTPGGVGLGLTVARGFTDAIGATLTPATTPGGGLTVRLSMPVVTSTVADLTGSAPAAGRAAPGAA